MKNITSLILSFILLFSGCTPPETQIDVTPVDISENSSFAVHFIDVGQADSSLILCDGQSMLIDGGNADDSNLIAAYLKKLGIGFLDYVICTHAHEDHVGGLSGALSVADAGAVYAPETESDSRSYRNFVKKASDRGLEIIHPTPGDVLPLGSSTATVLGPVTESADDINNTSIVLKITYGNTSFLFTGDAESYAEQEILDAGYDVSADVLKVGHHGSSTSSSYRFLREVMPKYGVISCGKDNSYGHPHDEILSRLRDAGAKLYRTDLQGDLIFTSDGENISVTTSKNSGIATNPTASPDNDSEEARYIGNKNSKKFHKSSCNSNIKEENKVYFYDRETAVASGFVPCKSCNP